MPYDLLSLHADLAPQVLDFFDTFFIVVRGKWDQFSFLHCYHHLSIFLTYWCGGLLWCLQAGPHPVVACSFQSRPAALTHRLP
jgi:hypothetical protein